LREPLTANTRDFDGRCRPYCLKKDRRYVGCSHDWFKDLGADVGHLCSRVTAELSNDLLGHFDSPLLLTRSVVAGDPGELMIEIGQQAEQSSDRLIPVKAVLGRDFDSAGAGEAATPLERRHQG